jgi:hypothetical protein
LFFLVQEYFMSELSSPVEPEAIPLLEMRLVGDELHCAMAGDVETLDPADWGRALAYLARIVAERTQEAGSTDGENILRDIRAAFLEELAAPTGQEGANA